MLQTFTNIRHFKSLAWDSPIEADFHDLYFLAYDEILYWLAELPSNNERPFHTSNPDWLCWTDASEKAIAACAVSFAIAQEPVPLTLDNILLAKRDAFGPMGGCAKLQADTFPWSQMSSFLVRDKLDFPLQKPDDVLICHRNLNRDEKATSSTERELLAIINLVQSLGSKLLGCTVTKHTDSMNASIICDKGSKNPRLQAYGKLIADMARAFNVRLLVKWIPRELNYVADYLSNEFDYSDYSITPEAFGTVCDVFQLRPDTDCFAAAHNKKCRRFFSMTYSPGCIGVDAFAYDWLSFGLCWIFTEPSVIGRALHFAKNCMAHILLLAPQWRNAYFYPLLMQNSRAFKRKLVFDGKNAFVAHADFNSYFGAGFKGNFEIYEFDFSLF
jgi:hypothetical protein